MKRGAISAVRLGIVIAFTLGAFLMSLGGMSAGEFVSLFIVGAICVVYILLADWIHAGERPKDPR